MSQRQQRRSLLGATLGVALWPCVARAAMEVETTQEDRFAALPDYPFAAHYTQVGEGLRMHYLAEGPAEGRTVVLLHGQPTWSYLWRAIVPPLAAAGHRVLAPDLIGFGKSSKPTQRGDYSYALHVQWVRQWLDSQPLRDATLVVHDWGGLIGLRLLAERPNLFARLAVLDTSFNVGSEWDSLPPAYRDGLQRWQRLLREQPGLRFSEVVRLHARRALSAAELAAYDAPFPDDRYNQGARAMSQLIPMRPDDPGAAENRAAEETLRRWSGDLLLAFSQGSERLHPGQRQRMREMFGRARLWADISLRGAGHFSPEDQPQALTALLLDFVAGRTAPPTAIT